MRRNLAAVIVAVAGLVLVAGIAAQTLPRLPDEVRIPRSKDSPGQVGFRHSSHVDTTRPDCTVCHPRLFNILGASSPVRETITHARMEKGRQCGACHDGKKGFALDEDCANCHAE